MVGRMIHSGRAGEDGKAQDYDPVHGGFIRSADRALLNMQLLDALEERGNVGLFFGHKLRKLKLNGEDGPRAEFEKTCVTCLICVTKLGVDGQQ